MNVALAWTWKEWRGQRALLGSYLGLVLACSMLGFLLVDAEWWTINGNRAQVLGWFVAAGSIGVVAFAAPQLVRGEFTAKEDQFLRRLPGALGSAFAGKLLFLLLCAAALPLLGLCAGELYLSAIGQSWSDLWQVSRLDRTVAMVWPLTWSAGLGSLLFAPWVFAIAAWLPGGRMAVGAAAVLAFGLAAAAYSLLSPYPGLAASLPATPWLCCSVPASLVVAWLSLVRGRRGGGHLRSAKLGSLALGALLLPAAGWLWSWIERYRHPDLQHSELSVCGLTPDHRFALALAAEHSDWLHVPVRIDLERGTATQVGAFCGWVGSVQTPAPMTGFAVQRCWLLDDEAGMSVFDLATGERRGMARKWDRTLADVPPEFRSLVAADARDCSPFRAPGKRRAWFLDQRLHVELADGSTATFAWPEGSRVVRDAGHGLEATSTRFTYFDLTTLRPVEMPAGTTRAFAVQGRWLVEKKVGEWNLYDPATGALEPRPELDRCGIDCLLDDEQVLVSRWRRGRSNELIAYRVADRRCSVLDPSPPGHDQVWHLYWARRGPGDRTLLRLRDSVWQNESWVMVDPATLHCEPQFARSKQRIGGILLSSISVLDFEGERALLAFEDRRRLVRLDLGTGTSTVLFPREAER